MNNGFNNQNYYNTTNTTTVVNTNPNAHKSKSQIIKEIEMLKKKIENNKLKLNVINEETKILIENMIAEDELKINELEYELKRKRNILIYQIILIIVALLFFIFYKDILKWLGLYAEYKN